jgi:hypothetical protein
MTKVSRRELALAVCSRYHASSKSDKTSILDEFVLNSGLNRKYVISFLKEALVLRAVIDPEIVSRRPRSRKYGADIAHAFMSLWGLSGGLCCKRLVPFLPDLIDALERFDELSLCSPMKDKLLVMSISTAERILRQERRSHECGMCTTRSGELLRHQIPIRTFEEWTDLTPGFLEIDLVAHGGGTAAGDYLYTLTMTDIYTGWTDCVALINRSQITVQAGIEAVRKRLPFALLGIDSDNGAEFINHHLKRYCDECGITFTRCRPYKKNDQCHVEQKNGAVVRPLVGYARYEGPEAAAHLNRLYAVKRLCLNYFEPSMKLVAKTRQGARVKKEYDRPKTPFQRFIETVSDEQEQQRLKEYYRSLNPAQLRRKLAELEAGLRRFTAGGSLQYDVTGGDQHGTHA